MGVYYWVQEEDILDGKDCCCQSLSRVSTASFQDEDSQDEDSQDEDSRWECLWAFHMAESFPHDGDIP